MKHLALVLSAAFIVGSAVANDSTDVFQHVGAGEKDSSVLIQTTKGAKVLPDYEIVPGEEDIAGDPTAGMTEARKSWKEACAEWKKELKENNKDGQVMTVSCGVAKFTQDNSAGAGSGLYVYSSHGTYKLRVRIKDK